MRLLLENTGGRIVFTHKAHSTPGGALGDISCATCHHELPIAPASAPGHAPEAAPDSGKDGTKPSVLPCTACHGAAEDPGFVLAHQERYRAEGGDASCLSCHHTSIAGLSEKWNHLEHREYAGDDCESCHHPQQFAFTPGRVMTIKPQRCANCHTPKPNPLTGTTRKEAAHERCESCHSDLFEAGSKGCATCHALVPPAAKSAPDATGTHDACASCHVSVSSGMDAFHNGCRGCHDRTGKGPGKEAPCIQCHAP